MALNYCSKKFYDIWAIFIGCALSILLYVYGRNGLASDEQNEDLKAISHSTTLPKEFCIYLRSIDLLWSNTKTSF